MQLFRWWKGFARQAEPHTKKNVTAVTLHQELALHKVSTSLSTWMKFWEICSQCSLIHIWAAELCWRAAIAMAKTQIKPQMQMADWTPRTHTRFEYEAKQPYSAHKMITTKKRMQTAGNAEPWGMTDGFFSMAYDDTPIPEKCKSNIGVACNREGLLPTALMTNVIMLHQNMILRVIMTYPARTVDACKEMMRRIEHATHRPPARLRLPPITACASSFELPANSKLLWDAKYKTTS